MSKKPHPAPLLTPIPPPPLARFEQYYDPVPVHHWMQDHPVLPMVACVVYAVLIFGGQYLMRNSESWKWRSTMSAWNLFLSVFSTMGMLRTAPQLIHNLTSMSLRDNLCLDPRTTYGSGSTGLWVQLFILSKFP
jgi:elongation of very long chain fatty acids protein 6